MSAQDQVQLKQCNHEPVSLTEYQYLLASYFHGIGSFSDTNNVQLRPQNPHHMYFWNLQKRKLKTDKEIHASNKGEFVKESWFWPLRPWVPSLGFMNQISGPAGVESYAHQLCHICLLWIRQQFLSDTFAYRRRLIFFGAMTHKLLFAHVA